METFGLRVEGFGLGCEVGEVRKEKCENRIAEGFVKASFPSQLFFFFPAQKTTRSTTRGVGLDIWNTPTPYLLWVGNCGNPAQTVPASDATPKSSPFADPSILFLCAVWRGCCEV